MKRINKFYIAIASFLMTFALASCGSSSGNAPTDNGNDNYNVPGTTTSQKVIYSVNYTIYSNEFHEVAKTISQKAIEENGYVQTSKESFDNAHYIYKIPAEKLNDFVIYIDSFDGIAIGSKTITSQDITSEYDEIQNNIDALEAQKEAYLKILENPETTEDARSQATKALTNINSELKLLYEIKAKQDSVVKYSTVVMDFYKSAKTESDIYWSNYFYYLRNVGKALGSIVLYSVPFAAVAGAAIGVAYLIKKKKDK